MHPTRSPASFFIRPNGRNPASLTTLSECSSHSPFTHSPAQDLLPLPTDDTATDSHASSRIRHSPLSDIQHPLPAATYRAGQVEPSFEDQDSSRIVERTPEMPHDFLASPRTPAMGGSDTIPSVQASPSVLARGSSSHNSLLLDTSTTQGGVTLVTDTASTLVSDMLSMTVPRSADVDPVVADAALKLAVACQPLFQQALQKIYDHARTESRT